MKPYYSADDDRVTVYHADALAALEALPDKSVDAIITDPPYSSGGFTRADRTSDVHAKYVQTNQVAASTGGGALAAFDGDNRDQRAYGYWCSLWIGECLRIAKPGAALAIFTDWRQLPITTDVIQSGGFVWRGIVPWHKPNGRNTQGRWANNCEYVVWGTAGPRSVDNETLPGFYQVNSPRNREHITQKPVQIMQSLAHIVPEDGVILDPFAGSGTTGVGAVLEGRRFIGVERNNHYIEVATRRLKVAQLEATTADSGEQSALDFNGQTA